MFSVVEKFISVDGEGPNAGELAVFIRFAGCNLRCKWCDTSYSWDGSVYANKQTSTGLVDYIISSQVNQVTITGGEPLIQPRIMDFLNLLTQKYTGRIHIETNGSIHLGPFKKQYKECINYIVDFKLKSSGMMQKMEASNLTQVGALDVYKFVVANKEDLQMAYEIIQSNHLQKKCKVHLSVVKGDISLEDVVMFMKEKKLNEVKLQPQLHKFIWDPEKRGV